MARRGVAIEAAASNVSGRDCLPFVLACYALRVTVVCVCVFFCGRVDKEVLLLPSIGYCNWRNSLGKKLNICVGWTPH